MDVQEFWKLPWVSTCGSCGERIEGNPPRPGDAPGVYDERGCRHEHCAPRDLERERQEIAARLNGPKRPGHVDAADANHLPLFVAANEPGFL